MGKHSILAVDSASMVEESWITTEHQQRSMVRQAENWTAKFQKINALYHNVYMFYFVGEEYQNESLLYVKESLDLSLLGCQNRTWIYLRLVYQNVTIK